MTDKQPAEALYQQLKQDIRDNKLPIACPLKQEQLAADYGVSRIPIRDVLQRLKNEGWLTQCGKRGVMVHPLSATEAEDLYLMRMYLEPLILSHAIPKLNHQILGKATDILERLDQPKLSIAQHGELNWQFHACLYEAAKRPTLFNNIANLHQLCSRYIGFHSVELNYEKTSQQQHYQLLEAIKAKQVSEAKSILQQHIKAAGQVMVKYLKHSKEL
ncbi:GntR family transcriptional regulator [uncultured Paraglaciecola sp.]|uniref:GntR family transcriptional regulator n=1 Tax=uncultured Paraglaciecola sp. TaxID=1765024 RepID=UPI0030DD9BCF|tara:strand:- start:125132 stop:125779 length:648 start_codon:yes stop_codon:yes gene_type:complete